MAIKLTQPLVNWNTCITHLILHIILFHVGKLTNVTSKTENCPPLYMCRQLKTMHPLYCKSNGCQCQWTRQIRTRFIACKATAFIVSTHVYRFFPGRPITLFLAHYMGVCPYILPGTDWLVNLNLIRQEEHAGIYMRKGLHIKTAILDRNFRHCSVVVIIFWYHLHIEHGNSKIIHEGIL